jgi:sugar/nucleoside kinase (ribokinase family)
MDKKFDVVVIGNVGIDTNVYLHGADIDFDVEANFTENLDYLGQAGGYASRGYARLGKRTAFVGHVGDDHHGRFIREEFARDEIDTTALFIDPAGTARSVNFMYHDGRRKNFYDGKGHMWLQPDLEVCRAVLADSKLAHFNIPNWARHLLPIAREIGLTVACDLQDVVSVDDEYRRDFIQHADILFCSAANYPDPTPLIESFLRANPDQIVIVGMGAQGCALGTRDGVKFFPAVDMDVPVIDTNGAGDGLAVGFLTSHVLDGYSLSDSVWRGQITARYTCAQKASSSSLITMRQLDRYFEEVDRWTTASSFRRSF